MLSRRSLLSGAAALAAAPVFSHAAETGRKGGQVKLGVASYSLRKKPLPEAIQDLKTLQVKYVNLKLEAHLPYTSTPAQVAEAKRMLDDAGIQLVGTGNTSLQKNDEADIRSKFEFNKRLGAPLMVIAPTRETLPLVEKCVKEFNIPVAIHNHGPEDKHFPSPQDVLAAIKGTDPRVGLCMDIGHSARAGADLVASIKQAGSRLHDMHGKDLRNTHEKDSQCDVGEGVLPIAAIFKQLELMHYPGYFNLEYEIHADDPLPGMERSFFYMRGVLAGLSA